MERHKINIKLANYSLQALSELNSLVIAEIKRKRAIDVLDKKAELRPGLLCTCSIKSCKGKSYEIIEVRQTKALCLEKETNKKYLIHMSTLQEIIK